MTTTVKKDGVAQVLKSLRELIGTDVLVGIPSTKTERKEPGEDADNATLGYIHEFGAPAAGIPARPFLIPGIDRVRPKINERMRKAALSAFARDSAGIQRQMTGAGMEATSSIKNLINDGIAPALAPYTLAMRKAKGFKGEKPLVRTGQLRNSITYVIRKK